MNWQAADYHFMARAIELAKRGRYTCEPNPAVGCVIVKQEQVIAEGWHERSGEKHAEINALDRCDATGSTVYLTLEPCSHYGQTPPCVDALIAAKVKQVVIAMTDPNPLVKGASIEKLQQANVEVKQGLLETEAMKLNRGFIKRMNLGLPYLSCKLAMSIDGRTALANGESRWISSNASRRDVHRLRAVSSAVMTTAETVIKDDPCLNARNINFDFKQPMRVVIDRQLRISPEANLFQLNEPAAGRVLIYTEQNDDSLIAALDKVGAKVIFLPSSASWLREVLSHLAKTQHINHLMVEAGSGFSGALLELGLVDELLVYMAPILLGNSAQSLVELTALEKLNDAKQLELNDIRQFGSDVRFSYQVN